LQKAWSNWRQGMAAALVLAASIVTDAGGQAGPPAGQGGAAAGQTVTVQLLAINDFHGNLEPPSAGTGQIGSTPAGGVEYLATHLKRAVAENPNSLIVAAGDLIGASPLLSGLFHDEPTIEAMNALGLTVSSVGNHEFDEGSAELLRMQHGGCHPTDGCLDGDPFGGATFDYLAANVLTGSAPDSPTLLPATTVRTVAGVKVGFIGETLKGTPRIVVPSGVAGLTFADEAATANRHAALLKAQGVNAIVLLIHEGGNQTGTGSTNPDGCANFQGAIVPIVQQLSADIKIVISGHTHQFYNCVINGRYVTSASSFGRMFTRLRVTVNRASGSIVGVEARNETVTRNVEKDPAETLLLTKYTPLAAPLANRVSGSLAGDVTRRANRAGESALGDLIADAQLAAAIGGEPRVQLAFMNPGGIRGDLIAGHQAGSEAPGQVTYGELFTVQPFNNQLMTATMTGDAIRRLLEQQFGNPSVVRSTMLQVSRGFTYSYALERPAGQRVDPASIKLNGVVVGAAAQVRVVANNFLMTGGDGFTVFHEATDQMASESDIDALDDYFRARSPLSSPALGRITRTD